MGARAGSHSAAVLSARGAGRAAPSGSRRRTRPGPGRRPRAPPAAAVRRGSASSPSGRNRNSRGSASVSIRGPQLSPPCHSPQLAHEDQCARAAPRQRRRQPALAANGTRARCRTTAMTATGVNDEQAPARRDQQPGLAHAPGLGESRRAAAEAVPPAARRTPTRCTRGPAAATGAAAEREQEDAARPADRDARRQHGRQHDVGMARGDHQRRAAGPPGRPTRCRPRARTMHDSARERKRTAAGCCHSAWLVDHTVVPSANTTAARTAFRLRPAPRAHGQEEHGRGRGEKSAAATLPAKRGARLVEVEQQRGQREHRGRQDRGERRDRSRRDARPPAARTAARPPGTRRGRSRARGPGWPRRARSRRVSPAPIGRPLTRNDDQQEQRPARPRTAEQQAAPRGGS